jgi:uncharacterized Tic20 family protein
MSDPQGAVAPAPHPLSAQDDRFWGAIAHLGGIFLFLPSLIIFLALRRNGSITRIESKEALNWQISLFICWLVVDFLVLIFGGIYVAAASAGGTAAIQPSLVLYLVWAVLWLVNAVFSVLGFLRVNRGGSYRYPIAVRFIK